MKQQELLIKHLGFKAAGWALECFPALAKER